MIRASLAHDRRAPNGPAGCSGNTVMTEAEMNYLLYPLVIGLALGLVLVSAASYSL